MSAGAGFRDHVDGIRGHQQNIGAAENGKIRIIPRSVPKKAGCAGKFVAESRDIVVASAPRRREKETSPEARELFAKFCCKRARLLCAKAIDATGPPDQHAEARMREIGDPRRKRASFGSESLRRSAMKCTHRLDNVRPAKIIVHGRNHKIEIPGMNGGILNLDPSRLWAPLSYQERSGDALPTCCNHEIGPGRQERLSFERLGHTLPKMRCERAPRLAQADAKNPRLQAQRFGKSETLAFHAGFAVSDNPTARKPSGHGSEAEHVVQAEAAFTALNAVIAKKPAGLVADDDVGMRAGAREVVVLEHITHMP